jgi:hypothetical protein
MHWIKVLWYRLHTMKNFAAKSQQNKNILSVLHSKEFFIQMVTPLILANRFGKTDKSFESTILFLINKSQVLSHLQTTLLIQ